MTIKIADTAKKSISLILSILIDPCTKVTKTGLVCSNIQFFESNYLKTVESRSNQISIFKISKFCHVHGLSA